MITQAFLLTRTGSARTAFGLSEVELPPLQEHEVMIETEAFGLNYADIMTRRGLHDERPRLPCVIGYESVGRVVQTGDKENRGLIGKRVVALTKLGAYSRHVIVNVGMILQVGEMNLNAALALALQGVTSYYISHYVAPIKMGEKVLIHAAAGGVGTLLVQLAKHVGATVIAKAGSEEKCHQCLALGADFAVNHKTHDYIEEVEKLIGKNNLDVSLNSVGGATFKRDFKLLGAGSKMVLFGGSELTAGKFGVLSKLDFLLRMGVVIPIFQSVHSRSLIGVNVLKLIKTKPHVIRECLTSIVELHQRGIVNPQNGGDFHFTELEKAHLLLESGKSIGKIAVCW